MTVKKEKQMSVTYKTHVKFCFKRRRTGTDELGTKRLHTNYYVIVRPLTKDEELKSLAGINR